MKTYHSFPTLRAGVVAATLIVGGYARGAEYSTPYQTKTTRFTPITPQCIRIEYSPSGRFIDTPSYFAINHDVVLKDYTIETDGDSIRIDTGVIQLIYKNDGEPLSRLNLKAEEKGGN